MTKAFARLGVASVSSDKADEAFCSYLIDRFTASNLIEKRKNHPNGDGLIFICVVNALAG